MNTALFALAALVPVMIGPLPQTGDSQSLVARLCNGGTITIPIPGKAPEEPAPCFQKGCHAGCGRKRFDPAQ